MHYVLGNSSDFKKILEKDIVLVDFFATWCGPCRMLGPELEKLCEENPDINVLKVDVDEYPEIAADFNVSSIPFMVLFKNGKPVANTLGYKNAAALKAWIKQN